MSNFIIITDSATDMPQWIIDKYNLEVLPTPVVIDGKDYFDGETIHHKEFYDIQRAKKSTISTYHINQYMFYNAFKPHVEKGEDILYFCFSTGIAGTFNAANLAKAQLEEEFENVKLDIMDSRCAAIGFGVCVYMALLMQEQGASKKEVMEAARFHFDNMEHIVTVETLEYLYRGGRLSRPAAVAGTLLDIKPVIEVTDLGKLEVFAKVRGRKKALKKVLEEAKVRAIDQGADIKDQIIGVVHADCEEECDEFIEQVKETYGCTKIVKAFLGCAIGAHTGPGLIGFCFLSKNSPYAHYFKDAETH